jgi:outer membrane biosynthesis protein TonB
MRRWSFITVISLTSFAIAQQSTARSPFSSDLVLWSHMQQPQQPEQDRPHQAPTPEPTPETQPAQNPTPSQPSQPGPSPKTSETPKQASTAQAFVGTINRQGDNFLLKISETISYKLDNQQEVQQYDGKRVRVTGTLDTSANLIHVDKVEPLT